MKKEDFLMLAGKIADSKATEEEISIYNNYLNQVQDGEQVWNQDTMGNPQLIHDALIEKIDRVIDLSEPKVKRFPAYSYWIGLAAASLLLVLSLFLKPDKQANLHGQTTAFKKAILPGGNKAILTLANGKQIILDHVGNGQLASEKNISIVKAKDGQLIFKATEGSSGKGGPDQNGENIISTPNGGQYEVNLSDGTKVWLNARSSLKFPSGFKGTTRHVELTGEAYFEVAKNPALPFIVSSNKMEVKVLGTHFNVKAYDDDQKSMATLLEGSISLSSNHLNTLLKPGQQGLLSQQTGKLVVSAAADGGDGAIAWKNGDFMFADEDIYTVMRQISRWYDVEITYKGDFKDLQFKGVISRFKNITEVLKLLELTDAVHFKVIGRRVIVMT